MNNLEKLKEKRNVVLEDILKLNSLLRTHEQKVFDEIINDLFLSHPILKSISWEQYYDEYLEFDLKNLVINDLDIEDFCGITAKNREKIKTFMPIEPWIEGQTIEEYKQKVFEKHQNIIPAINQVVEKLGELHNKYGFIFFKSLFGIGVEVLITREQIKIKKYEGNGY